MTEPVPDAQSKKPEPPFFSDELLKLNREFNVNYPQMNSGIIVATAYSLLDSLKKGNLNLVDFARSVSTQKELDKVVKVATAQHEIRAIDAKVTKERMEIIFQNLVFFTISFMAEYFQSLGKIKTTDYLEHDIWRTGPARMKKVAEKLQQLFSEDENQKKDFIEMVELFFQELQNPKILKLAEARKNLFDQNKYGKIPVSLFSRIFSEAARAKEIERRSGVRKRKELTEEIKSKVFGNVFAVLPQELQLLFINQKNFEKIFDSLTLQ